MSRLPPLSLIVKQNGATIHESTVFTVAEHAGWMRQYEGKLKRVDTVIELVDEEEIDLGRVQGERRRFKKPVK